jgi:hypothetical protein
MTKKPWAVGLCLHGINVLHTEERVWELSIPAGRECSELNSRFKKLRVWCVPTAPKWQMKSQQQQGLAMVLATEFCLMTWTCLVLPSTVFHVSWCKTVTNAWTFVVTWLIVLTKMGRSQPDHNRRWMVTILREDVDICKCMSLQFCVTKPQSTKLLTVIV